MFDALSARLSDAISKLTGQGRIPEADVDVAMREVRLAILEADVNYKVVKDLVTRIKARAVGQDVLEVTMIRLPVTIALSMYALVLTLLMGMASGIVAALRQNTVVDQLAMVFAMIGISVPNFFLGLLMILLFAVYLGWLPTGGYIPLWQDPIGWLRTSTMPALSLGRLQMGLLARITRSTMLELLRQDYIRTARA